MFKPGDKVICLFSEYGNETVGKIYTVLEQTEDDWFRVTKDDNGYQNGYNPQNFRLVTKVKERNLPNWF